jgi:hypothetical protein
VNNIKVNSLEWDLSGMPEAPSAPETMQQTGLTLGFLSDLLLRALYTRGGMPGLDVARLVCLPFKIVEEALGFLKHEKCVEVLGGDLIGRISYKFNLTELGRQRAQDAFKMWAPQRDIYERIFANYCKKLGLNPCPDAIEYLYDQYYNRGRSPRASDCRDLLETVQSICRFRRIPVQLTKQLMVDAANSFIREFV